MVTLEAKSWEGFEHGRTNSSQHAGPHQVKVRGSSNNCQWSALPRVIPWSEGPQNGFIPEGLLRFHRLDQDLFTLDQREWEHHLPTWTTITDDIDLILHLLTLYFCWEYPIFAPFSKKHFLQDFREGRHRYCSPLLVNALLALGCRFSTNLITGASSENLKSAGDHFFEESQRLFNRERDHHSLTTIQALVIMSIRETSCGRSSVGQYYAGQSVRLVLEMGLHRTHNEGDRDGFSVQSATFWGAFSMDNAYSLVLGLLPNCSRFLHLPSKPPFIRDIEASLWVPYTDDGALLEQYKQPSNEQSVYKCSCELGELIQKTLHLLYSPGQNLTTQNLMSIYIEYLCWYDNMPKALRVGHNFTPALLFTHIYYHFAILLLFQHFVTLPIIGSEISPRDICLQAANAIQGFLTIYSRLYTLKWAPSFMPYFALASSLMHLALMAQMAQINNLDTPARTDPHLSEAVNQGIARLIEMRPCHQVAEQALQLLCYLARKWNVDLNIEIGAALDPEAYERLVRSFGGIINFLSPTMVTHDYFSDLFTG